MNQGSENYHHGQFVNLIPTRFGPPKGKWSILGKMLLGKNQCFPRTPPTITKLTAKDFENPPGLGITWLGHSTNIVDIDGHRIMIDPMLGLRASPVPFLGPRRFNPNLPIEAKNLPAIDFVLVSHDHYDHLDRGTIKAIDKKVRHYYVPLKVGKRLQAWGVSPLKITEQDWWDSSKAGDLRLIAAPARHFSGRSLRDRNTTLWTSWIIIGPKHRVYCSGDGGYSETFKKIGRKYGPFNLTLMECGQYNLAWAHSHMLPEESVQAHLDLRGEVMIPIHWGAFNLSIHKWTEPIERALAAARETGVNLATPMIGGQVVYGQPLPQDPWW